MFYLTWHHTHIDSTFPDVCWRTYNFPSIISWFLFTASSTSFHWFFAPSVVSMRFCWMILLWHTSNSSTWAIYSTMVLTYWLIVTKAKFLLHQKLPSVSNFHLLIALASINFMKLVAIGHLYCTYFRLSFSLVSFTKYFVLPLFQDFPVASKYCSTALLENRGSSAKRNSFLQLSLPNLALCSFVFLLLILAGFTCP